jgi:hypothetical protein
MSDELDRFFISLHRDADNPVLTDAAAIRHTGTRRTRTNRVVGAGVACLAAIAAVAGATALAGHGSGSSRVPVAPSSSLPPSGPPSGAPGFSGPPSGPASAPPSLPPPSANQACRVADLTETDHSGDGAMGTYFWGITFTNTGAEACYLDARAQVWLTDPDTGHDVKLVRDPGQLAGTPDRVDVAPGQQVAVTLRMAVQGLVESQPSECTHTVTYETVKVQFADGIFVGHNQAIAFACRGDKGNGPYVSDWATG